MFASERQFKLWDYNVSHQQLLIRSPATGEEIVNIDIVFWGVQQLSLPSILDHLSVKIATDEELATFPDSRMTGTEHPFLIESTASRGLVFASGCKVLQNELEIFDSSLMYFDRDRPEEEYGDVLAKS